MGFDYEDNDGLVVCIPGDPYTNVTVKERGKNVLVIRLTGDYVGSLDVEVTRELAEKLCEALLSKLECWPSELWFGSTSV